MHGAGDRRLERRPGTRAPRVALRRRKRQRRFMRAIHCGRAQLDSQEGGRRVKRRQVARRNACRCRRRNLHTARKL